MSKNDLALSVRGLSKSYTIAHQKTDKHSTLAEQMLARFRRPFQRTEKETFSALKDVSFEIQKGDIVGIIGRNGAGKSTLLKILSRITEPTKGEIDVYGPIGSLLEVGTGFHPELTGRENIFLNGAILGMSRSEIRKQFDAIVDFAGVEKFLDTPVKRYSSGMYVRLAFAVAAHLNPEILIVDEVLAVGDQEFQKKCMGKMQEVATGEGRTVLFVSHNMGAVSGLCSRSIFLKSGELCIDGTVEESVKAYLSQGTESKSHVDPSLVRQRKQIGPGKIINAKIKDSVGQESTNFMMGDELMCELVVASDVAVQRSALSLEFKTATGIPVLHLTSIDDRFTIRTLSQASTIVQVRLPHLQLYPGEYLLSFWLGDVMGHTFDYLVDCASISVHQGEFIERSGLSWNHAIYHQNSSWSLLSVTD